MSVVAFADPAGWPSTNTTPQVKELKNFSKKIEKPLDKPHEMWYNVNVKREEDNGDSLMEKYSTSKISKENFENPLDNHQICGIINT